MESINAFVSWLNGIVWGPYMIALLVGTGIYLTIRLRFVQVRHLGHSVRCVSGKYSRPEEHGDITPFQALAAALAATIGTGNIAGVATAIALGGPGAVFWMWVTAVVGMATKFTSCALAVKFRVEHEDGTMSGGPMYFIANGLGLRWLGVLFALFAGLASFGIGCAVQSNSVTDALLSLFPNSAMGPRVGGVLLYKPVIGLALAFLVGVVIIGGIKRIAGVASRIVPVMCALYLLGAFIVLGLYAAELPQAFAQIFRYAFTPVAAGAGFLGMVLSQTIRMGVARGVFSNESGLGSAPMAHAVARTSEMARQGYVAMLGPFIDTLVVCTMTALVIIATGAWQVRGSDGIVFYGPGGQGVPVSVTFNGQEIDVVGEPGEGGMPFLKPGGDLLLAQIEAAEAGDGEAAGILLDDIYYRVPTGASLTADAFALGLGRIGRLIVVLGICLFAYSTMITWSYYGDRCWEYLLGERAVKPYRYVFCVFILLGAVGGLKLVWDMADTLNGLMAVPNLIGLIGLSGLVAKEARDYGRRMKDEGRF